MPLALPPADERTFASLVADARSRIPRLAPGWTDHNVHDPGITLVELFAHLTEMDLYRLGRVTAAQRRAFARWFGLAPTGPTVAETVVALHRPSTPGVAPVPVPLDADLEITSGTADLIFSTTAPVTVQPAGISGLFVGERPIDASDPPAAAALLDTPQAALGPWGRDELTITLDRPVSGEVSLYLWTGAADHDHAARRRLLTEAAEAARDRAALGIDCPASRADDGTRHYAVDLAWEIFTTTGWRAVTDVADGTRALSLSGLVRLQVDGVLAKLPGTTPAAYGLRVRVVRGRYDAPPVVRAVLLNAVPARHQSRSFQARLGSSNGRSAQVFRLGRIPDVPRPGRPLVFDRTEVAVTFAGGVPTKWPVATNWDRAGSDSPVVVLDPETAELRFGDGQTGRVPRAASQIDLVSRVGGGSDGNVAAYTLKRLAAGHGPFEVLQPFAAHGGGPDATVADLQARALESLAQPTRAATLGDLERLALETPGIPSGRAYAIADHHPRLPGLPAPGCVTVVVVPNGVGAGPEPTHGFLTAVRTYLGRRRPVATELHVIAPTYTQVAVRARLHLGPYADAAAVLAEAAARIDAFLHPLTGGPQGDGWPVGRDVYRSEVLALLQGIPGVGRVDQLSLLVGPARSPACHNVSVCPTDLVVSQPHELTVAPSRIR